MSYFVLELIKRVLKIVLKIRYDLEILSENQLQIEKMLADIVYNKNKEDEELPGDGDNDFESLLPITSEDELTNFEIKLTNKKFKINVVS